MTLMIRSGCGRPGCRPGVAVAEEVVVEVEVAQLLLLLAPPELLAVVIG